MDELERICEAVRMDLYADYCRREDGGDGMYEMVAGTDVREYRWTVSALVFWWRRTDTINAIVDAFRREHGVGC